MMRMMRKLLAGILVLSVLLAGAPAGAASFSKGGASIRYGGAVFRIGQTSTKWKSKLGKYTRKLNKASGSLASYTYTFKGKGIKVSTLYSKKYKKEKIVSVAMIGNAAATGGGLRVGNSKAKMTRLYGTKYSRKGSVYTYKAGGRRLVVKASGNRVSGIKIS